MIETKLGIKEALPPNSTDGQSESAKKQAQPEFSGKKLPFTQL